MISNIVVKKTKYACPKCGANMIGESVSSSLNRPALLCEECGHSDVIIDEDYYYNENKFNNKNGAKKR